MAAQTSRRRWVHVHANDGVGTGVNFRLQRAYGEGRKDIQAANPYSSSATGADYFAFLTWELGQTNKANAAWQFETFS